MNFRNPESIIAIGVTIISLCALVVSVKQTQIMQEERELMREYSRASVWPRLEFGISKGRNDDGSIKKFSIMISNSGVGPAIITDVQVKYDGKTADNWWHLFSLQEIPDSVSTIVSNANFNGRIIKIGETLRILDLDRNPTLGQAFYERVEKLTLDIYYESIYGEKWKYEIGVKDQRTITVPDFDGLLDEEQFGN